MDIREKYLHLDPETYDFSTSYTRTNPDRGYMEQDVVMALILHRGNFSGAARELGRSRSSLANHVNRNDSMRHLRQELYDEMLDEIEFGALATALAGDPTQQRFFLTTIAKDRGYVTRNETTGKDGEPLGPTMDTSSLDNETLEKLMDAMDRMNENEGSGRLHS